eukprot:2320423-Rhodomonas_salina.2
MQHGLSKVSACESPSSLSLLSLSPSLSPSPVLSPKEPKQPERGNTGRSSCERHNLTMAFCSDCFSPSRDCGVGGTRARTPSSLKVHASTHHDPFITFALRPSPILLAFKIGAGPHRNF